MNKNKKTGRKYEESKFDDKFDSKTGKGRKGNPNRRWKKDESSYGHNDVSWYTPDMQLLNDAGRWPYSRPVGTPLNRKSLFADASNKDYAVPGVCMAHAYITIGDCEDGQSAANVAASAVYTFVRHVNSGSRNYDANDLMLYIMAIDSIYTYVTWLTRIYSTIPMYAQMNKYMPDELAALQGVDLESIRANAANFRAKFNALLMKIGTLVVPDSMPIFRRHAFLFQNYYSEGPSIKDQLYFYTLENVYKFDLDASGAGMLKNILISDYYNANNILDAAGALRLLEDLITPIFNDEDFNIMSGDILKAYDGKILSLMLLNENMVAMPVNNVTFLEQFKNIKCISGSFPTASKLLDIYQDANKEFLYVNIPNFAFAKDLSGGDIYVGGESTYPEKWHIAADQWSRDLVLTTELTDVTPEVNMLNTRLVTALEVLVDPSHPSGLAIHNIAYGSELITGVEYALHDENWGLLTYETSTVEVYDVTNINHVTVLNNIAFAVAPFRFHPELSFVGYDSSSSPTTYVGSGLPLLGIDNFTTIDYDHVAELHNVAILGEYNVPRLAIVK